MPTINGVLRTNALRIPEHPALRFGDRLYTYRELDDAVDGIARVLTDLGLTKGDRLALMAHNSDLFVLTFYATLRVGAVFVPINPASAPPELEYLLEDSGASMLVADPALVTTVAAIADRVPTKGCRILTLGPSHTYLDLVQLARDTDNAPVRDTPEEGDDALILYTSGTTGKPKGALFDHHRSMWAGSGFVAACGMREGDRFLHVAPLYHAAELCIMLIPGTAIGATHVVLPSFDPSEVLQTMERERITMFFGVPTMFQLMLRHAELRTRDLSAWRTAMFGAAPMPASSVEQLLEAVPHVDLMQLCGQTEGGPGGIYSNGGQVRARPEASGRQALPFSEARVVDNDDRDVSAGEVGELILRGESVMKGYWRKPEASAEALRGGWLRTGDLARLDGDGFITLVDRLKDLIITGGRNVYSVEVENALAAHPGILDCAVVARSHPEYGESIVAIVDPRDGAAPTLDEIKEFCAGRIAGYKIPHEIVVGTIPRSLSGKILKNALREALPTN